MGGLVVLLAIGALVVASKGEQEEKMPQDIYCGDMNCYEVLLDKLKCCQANQSPSDRFLVWTGRVPRKIFPRPTENLLESGTLICSGEVLA